MRLHTWMAATATAVLLGTGMAASPAMAATSASTGLQSAGVGSVVAPSATVHGCPSGYYCFYQNTNYGGRRVQYHDCTEQALPSDFIQKASSWVNNRSSGTVRPYDVFGEVLWTSPPNSSSSNVGTAANDEAIAFTCR